MLRQMPCYPIGCGTANAVRAGVGGDEMWASLSGWVGWIGMGDCDATTRGLAGVAREAVRIEGFFFWLVETDTKPRLPSQTSLQHHLVQI